MKRVDSVLVGNDYRKRWNINPYYNISIIEGIGSTYGLIELSPGAIVDFPYYSLTCFLQDSITLYPNSTTNCDIISNISTVKEVKTLFRIEPNPFHNTASIKAGIEFEHSALTCYNGNGILICHEKNVDLSSFVLNGKVLASGLYFLQLVNENGKIISQKFVVD